MVFDRLFSPIRIGNVQIPNRIFLAPHGTNYVYRYSNEQLARYYQERARGGVGLIIHEAVYVHPGSYTRHGKVCGWEREAVPGYRRVVEAVHSEGVPIFCQLVHMGRQMTSFTSRRPVVAPSAIPCAETRETPHVLTEAEIQEIINYFAISAVHCRDAGMDGVEIHAANGYLIQQFLSPVSNQRQDRYGGSFENRMRFLREVIDAVRGAVGKDFVVGVRLCGAELVPGGLTLEDSCAVASELQSDGQIDYISVSVGNYSTHSIMIADMSYPRNTIAHLSAGIKAAGVHLPVLVAIRIAEPADAERILEQGQADMVGMARALIADPHLPRKAREGRLAEIRPCIYCLQECRDRVGKGGKLSCLVNPTVGMEGELEGGAVPPAQRRKRVVVVGGGVAGLECAITAARRGHEVILFEAAESLGGQCRLAAQIPIRSEFHRILDFLSGQVYAVGVDVRLSTYATAEQILSEEPDVVVVATGSQPNRLDVPGGEQALSVNDVLSGRAQVGRHVVVYDSGEGSWPFCGAVEYLSAKGLQVHAVTCLNSIGPSIPALSIPPLYERLFKRGVQMWTLQRLESIAGGNVILRHVYSHELTTIPDVDSVVAVVGRSAQDQLVAQLDGLVPELHVIGDALAPRQASDAIREGHFLARNL